MLILISNRVALFERRHLEALAVGADNWDHYVLAQETPPGMCYIDEENVRLTHINFGVFIEV